MKRLFSALLCSLFMTSLHAATQVSATAYIDARNRHQHITGFGGFVCSPQFTYGHMSTEDIKKVWGSSSTIGCNIMRLYIPIGKNSWQQSLETAKLAKQMGLLVFASPWGQPSEWKTNGTINAKNEDGQLGRLKAENWADYAQYLEDYVQYMRNNGVELDAISIQNEPDWQATYAGCLWSAEEIARFVKTYGPKISCKVMAPETLSVNDNYVNALNESDVLNCFDIYGGHQYGGIQSGYKELAAKGKEIWMTEYLINWNEGQSTSRNFDYSKDFFNFFRAINVCMLGDFNAWIHYASKRFYGMLGDGQYGSTDGTVTKRGYIMAHFARFVTGMTRIDASFGSSGLEGSAYISDNGDTTVVVMANSTGNNIELTVDLPFYTLQGYKYVTNQLKNISRSKIEPESETCRPTVIINSNSVTTLVFYRSRDRQVSDMTGSMNRYGLLNNMKATRAGFGTEFKLSGKTRTFDHSNPLLSSFTNAGKGYVQFDSRYDKLVMQINSVSSTMNYTSSQTTLIYVNGQGAVSTHDYGEMDLNQRENITLVFDLSEKTLTDGCTGLISMTNNNYSSVLTITFGDVYLSGATQPYSATLKGDFVADDGHVLEYTSDANCTSLDMTKVTNMPKEFPWENGNRIIYVPVGSGLDIENTVDNKVCANLSLSATGGQFRPAKAFTAQQACFSVNVEGYRLLTIPFNAVAPANAKAYSIDPDLNLSPIDSIPAHTPFLLEAQGEVVLTGSGNVSYYSSPMTNVIRGVYCSIELRKGDYILGYQNGQWGFIRQTSPSVLGPFGVYLQLASQDEFVPLQGNVLPVSSILLDRQERKVVYDIDGRVNDGTSTHQGIRIIDGKKVLVTPTR